MLPAPLLATLEREQPTQTLMIHCAQAYPAEETPTGLIQVTPEQVLAETYSERTDLIFIRGDCLNNGKERLTQLVAKCRDLLSSRVLVEIGPQATLGEADMLALAFTRYAVTATQNGEFRYFYFDLKTYKPVPDWLNPKFWANPQNWDKYRW